MSRGLLRWQVTVESRLKYLEQALADSDAKHQEEPVLIVSSVVEEELHAQQEHHQYILYIHTVTYINIYTHTYNTCMHAFMHTYTPLHYITLHCIALHYITLIHTDRQTYIHTCRHADMQTYMQTYTQTYRHT